MNARVLWTSAWTEAKLFVREPMTVLFTLILPLLFLLVLGGVFGNKPNSAWQGQGPVDFYVPAYLGLVWASVGLLVLPVHLARYREDGVLRRLRASAAPKWAIFGSQAIVASAIALAGGGLLIAAAELIYHIRAPHSVAGVLGAWLLAGLVFAALGLLLSCVPTSRGVLGAGLGLFFVMMMLSGSGPPFKVMSSPLRHVSNILPLTYVTRILEAPWLGTSLAWTDVAVAAGIALAAGLIAVIAFRWE
jgi:ABC-2 type transport system permease protein